MTRVLVCRRVADLPHPPVSSAERQCGICGAPVWAAASSPDADAVWCIRCAFSHDRDLEFEPLTKRQIADIRTKLQ